MKRALVSGGAGFVGANLARHLLRAGHEVHLLVRPRTPRWRITEIDREAQVHEGDLEDGEGIAALVAAVRPDWVFHLAARGAYVWQDDLDEVLRTNIVGTAHILEASLRAGVEAFVNAGSSSEYGSKDHAPTEDEALEPSSAYAVSKAAATLLCRALARGGDTRVSTLRLYSVYGPYEEPGRLIPTLIAAGVAARLPPLVSPETAHDFVYVEDAAEAFLLAASSPGTEPGAVFNVGTGRQLSIREVVEVTRATFGIAAEPGWGSLPARPWDTDTWVADTDRIRAELGWEARRSFAAGFAETVDWFRGSGDAQRLYAATLDP